MKNNKTILIIPPSDCVFNDRLEPPLGMMYIAAVLKENGSDNVAIYDMSGCKDEQDIKKSISDIPYGDFYGFTVYCTNHKFAKACINRIRTNINKNSVIVAGGPNPTAMPEFTLDDLNVDYVVTGEGEDAFLHILRNHNTIFLSDRIIKGTGRKNIDSYPFPARELIDLSSYSKTLMGNPTISVLTARGCFHKCLFCNSIVMGGKNPYARYRSTSNILKEIDYIQSINYRYIRFTDDNFTSNPDLHSLLKRLSEKNITFRAFARLDDLSKETCNLLKSAGCVHISVGIESLNPLNLKVIGKKHIIGKEGNLSFAKESGLMVRASFMVGLPFDNHENIEKYFNMAAELPFDEFEVIPLIPFPGTSIAQNPGKWGYEIINDDFTNYVLVGKDRKTTFAMKHKNFTVNDVIFWRKYVDELFKSAKKEFMKDSLVAN